MNRERTFDLDSVIAQAEAREARPAGKSQIREMAERMAAERQAKLRDRGTAPRPLVVAPAPAPVPVPAAIASAPRAARKPRRRGGHHPRGKTKSLQLLRALSKQTKPIDVPGLHKLLPEIASTSIAAYMGSFAGRGWAVRSGELKFYKYKIGAKGAEYLKTFHPPD